MKVHQNRNTVALVKTVDDRVAACTPCCFHSAVSKATAVLTPLPFLLHADCNKHSHNVWLQKQHKVEFNSLHTC